jgi:hypothetical protein
VVGRSWLDDNLDVGEFLDNCLFHSFGKRYVFLRIVSSRHLRRIVIVTVFNGDHQLASLYELEFFEVSKRSCVFVLILGIHLLEHVLADKPRSEAMSLVTVLSKFSMLTGQERVGKRKRSLNGCLGCSDWLRNAPSSLFALWSKSGSLS